MSSRWAGLIVGGTSGVAVAAGGWLAPFLPGPWIYWLLAPVAGLSIGLTAQLLNRRSLAPLARALRALALRERFVQVPYTQTLGPLGQIAQAALKLREAVTDADTLAAERQAEGQQQTIRNQARAVLTGRFETDAATLLSEMSDATQALSRMAETLLSHAEAADGRSATGVRTASTVSAQIGTMASASDRLAQVIEGIRERADESRTVTASTVATVASTNASVAALTEATDRIASIATLIGVIAQKTQMLALNASIEAARAGEAGRGFAVVANEVKALSAQITAATADIRTDVGQMSGAVTEAVTAISNIAEAIGGLDRLAAGFADAAVEGEMAAAEIGRTALMAAGGVGTLVTDLTAAAGAAADTKTASDQVMGVTVDLTREFETLRHSVAGFLGDIRGGGIRVGVLHSLSGTMAGCERPLQDLLVMMIEEVNRAGGLLGRPLEAVIVNPRSDWPLYGSLARKLLTEDKVSVLFGCWTSISRKEVLPVVEELGGLLLYPVQYEGEEQSPNIFYTGATPNQQALPAVDYLMSPQGGGFRRFYLVGTDYVYPQITNKILQGYLQSKGIGGSDVAVSFTPFGHEDWSAEVAAMRRFAAGGKAAVISTVNGDANVYFYRELARQGVTAATLPVMAFSVGENEAASLGAGLLDGHLVAWNYLMSLEAPENHRFIEAWRRHTGDAKAVTDDPMEATWIGFHLWCAAVGKAGTTDPKAVAAAMAGSRITGPGGVEVMMDPQNHHLHKPLAIGRVTADGRITTILRAPALLPPAPSSPYLSANPERVGSPATTHLRHKTIG